MSQLPLIDAPPLPRLSRRYTSGYNSAKSASLESKEPNPHRSDLVAWRPGECKKYSPVTPPGYTADFDVPIATPDETSFRHSGWAHQRRKVIEAMQRVSVPHKRLQRMMQCGANAWVYARKDGGKHRVQCCYCHDRLCKACGAQRSRRIVQSLCGAMKDRDCRFVTLTLRHTQTPLCDQITRLYSCFVNLRRHQLWKKHVKGGAAFCEVKRSARDGKWHVHLHMVIEGTWIAQRLLSSAWLAVTGDSHVVDVRPIPHADRVASYISKYATKPIDASVIDNAESLDEAIIALRGRRLCTTFGSWRGTELDPECAPDESEWTLIGRLDAVCRAARNGEQWASGVVLSLGIDLTIGLYDST